LTKRNTKSYLKCISKYELLYLLWQAHETIPVDQRWRRSDDFIEITVDVTTLRCIIRLCSSINQIINGDNWKKVFCMSYNSTVRSRGEKKKIISTDTYFHHNLRATSCPGASICYAILQQCAIVLLLICRKAPRWKCEPHREKPDYEGLIVINEPLFRP
jgi:hypothetical protein